MPSCLAGWSWAVEKHDNRSSHQSNPLTTQKYFNWWSSFSNDVLEDQISTILDKGLLSRNISGLWEKGREVFKCTWFIPKVFAIEDSIGKCRSGLCVVGLCNGKEPWGDRQVTSGVLKGGLSQLRLLLLPTLFTCFKRELIAKKKIDRILHQSYQ